MRAQEFILETTEETQIINIIATRATETIQKIIAGQKAKLGRSPHDVITEPKMRLGTFGVKLRDLNIPQVSSPNIKTMLNKVDLRVDTDVKANPDAINTASYVPNDGTGFMRIIVKYRAVVMYAKKEGFEVQHVLERAIAHEMQHALDDIKTSGVALKDPTPAKTATGNLSDQDYETYLKLPYEVNARFAQSAVDVAKGIANGNVKRENLASIIKLVLSNNELVEIFKDRPRAYNQLAKRMYKFFEAELAQPKKIEPGSLFAKVKSWLTNRPAEVIR